MLLLQVVVHHYHTLVKALSFDCFTKSAKIIIVAHIVYASRFTVICCVYRLYSRGKG